MRSHVNEPIEGGHRRGPVLRAVQHVEPQLRTPLRVGHHLLETPVVERLACNLFGDADHVFDLTPHVGQLVIVRASS
jgi:hypothetical protein